MKNQEKLNLNIQKYEDRVQKYEQQKRDAKEDKKQILMRGQDIHKVNK